jgi:hypothetical protein
MPTNYCRHIRPSGRRCQSPALRSRPFCYYHERSNAHLRGVHLAADDSAQPTQRVETHWAAASRDSLLPQQYAEAPRPIEINFPALEDAESVQISLSMLLTALGQNRIEPKRAATMLYNLQIAAGNIKRLAEDSATTVTDPVFDTDGTPIAPDEDPQEVQEFQALLQSIEEEEADRRKHRDENEEDDEDEEDEDDDTF